MSEIANKEVVRRFNIEVIQEGRREAFDALMASDFVNRSAPAGTPNDAESMWNTFKNMLHPALTDLTVIIHEQIAEDDKVSTRKTIHGVHTGQLLGIAPTGNAISIDVIDVVRVRDGRYIEHWGINSLSSVLAGLRA
ncbi:ester cyclase [Rhodanobacter glycinis]|jgi:predicted ester cyclase|uniref:SnoaL-like polyketide cyclase n=1 Tax=Rhodanobacter glycinis TaxID=582702 RepID=A0A1I3YCT4_9GAMM|nr:ester cyclase [Rhodanobacter glycinis]SFK29006.1 SnoaL-like polyketide cyclase [Rhodanobacter glycinis]